MNFKAKQTVPIKWSLADPCERPLPRGLNDDAAYVAKRALSHVIIGVNELKAEMAIPI